MKKIFVGLSLMALALSCGNEAKSAMDSAKETVANATEKVEETKKEIMSKIEDLDLESKIKETFTEGYTNLTSTRYYAPVYKDAKYLIVSYAEKDGNLKKLYVYLNDKFEVVDKFDFDTTKEYRDLETKLYDKYKDKDILDITVSPYSKGVDLTFVTNNKNFSKDEFNKIAEEAMDEFKNITGMRDAKLSVALNLNSENSENLFTVK